MKRGLALFIFAFILFSISFTAAQANNETANLENAYQCVKTKVGEDCKSLTFPQQVFSILSLGDYKDCKESFLNLSTTISESQECWPSTNCNPKDTALALLTLDRLGLDTSKTENWLLNQTKTASELIWILQTESDEATACTITYSSGAYEITINEDKTITKDAGPCLKRTQQNYWLKISSGTCIDEEYKISCDQDFKTNLLYKSPGSDTIHVSQNIHQESALGETKEKINFKCFKKDTLCNFESSLWAALVLDFKGYDITNFIPYLEASAEENSALFPESLLYIITRSEDYLAPILSTRFNGEFWSAGSGNKFYDTALGLLSLQSENRPQSDAAKKYQLNGKTQTSEGCWGTAQDTGFLLYSGWPLINPSDPTPDPDPNPRPECDDENPCSGDQECIDGYCYDPDDPINCEQSSNSFHCVPYGLCDTPVSDGGAGGEVLTAFGCPHPLDNCCSEEYIEPTTKTCAEIEGAVICDSGYICPFGYDAYEAEELDCCLTACEEDISVEETECEENNLVCRDSENGCFEDSEEEEDSYSCNTGEICCKDKDDDSPGLPWLWITILVILIILVILGIVFRKKLRAYLFKFKSGFKSKKTPRRPGPPHFPPGPRPRRMPMRRPLPPRRPIPPQARQPMSRQSSKDKDFEDTLKKLKDMSK
ncbi:hypothetical protein CMI46_00785 [Candidatus Pacearchaeota archaeon]|nr:hypothetical protein [Candidatus Pacearchaeota archaeon]|tara:strand:- start:501 stop:2465 length:1965 start_codon:yes stop_codon:yes gene_type:complete